MGKVSKALVGTITFTPIQKIIFNAFSKQQHLVNKFYFTGGTALSAVYLHHRESEDLDFFSQEDFENDLIFEFISQIATKIKAKPRTTLKERARIFEFFKENHLLIKVDFAFYPYQRLEQGANLRGVSVDSLLDIGANKIMTITQRTDVKDYVDLYFLLKQHTFWDLLNHSQKKFKIEIDLILLAANFLRINQFDYLPKMLIPLKLEGLQIFYKDLAKRIGLTVVDGE